jgi:hypothetical protein
MLLLVKGHGGQGLAAHIPDGAGAPLCKTNLKRVDWQIQQRVEHNVIVCAHCKRIQGQTRALGEAPL